MRATRVMANLRVADIEATEGFYSDYLGLTTEPWGVRRFFVRAPDGNGINVMKHRD
jgi:predicted enzyme related to lactoylglutathione lyase